MNSTKPVRMCVCRGCTNEFERIQANQRYCDRCRVARAEAMEALRVKVCNRCGVERDDTKLGLCPDCRQAKDEAAKAERQRINSNKLARFNVKGGCKCGAVSTCPHNGLCDECEAKRFENSRRAEHQRARQQSPEKPQQEGTGRIGRLSQRLDAMSIDAQLSLLKILIIYLELQDACNPEDIAADNQDDIDSAFRDLMGGINL